MDNTIVHAKVHADGLVHCQVQKKTFSQQILVWREFWDKFGGRLP
jgi:hypothetical protein